jgi:hypothetical protein
MAGELRNKDRSEVGMGSPEWQNAGRGGQCPDVVGIGGWCFGFVVNGLWFERRCMDMQTVVVSNGLKRGVNGGRVNVRRWCCSLPSRSAGHHPDADTSELSGDGWLARKERCESSCGEEDVSATEESSLFQDSREQSNGENARCCVEQTKQWINMQAQFGLKQ